MEGVKLAKARGVYKGRVKGSGEDVQQFLSKPKNRKALAKFNLLSGKERIYSISNCIGIKTFKQKNTLYWNKVLEVVII